MKKESAVSTPAGTALLLVIVVLVAGLCAISVFSAADSGMSETPVVFFSASADEHALYHAGGDKLFYDDISVYSENLDITSLTRIDGRCWTVWKTGDLLSFGNICAIQLRLCIKTGRYSIEYLMNGYAPFFV